MAFNWFKKKEVMDLRKGQSDIVVSDDVKKRFASQQSSGTAPAPSSAPATSSQDSGGGFFSFFGSSSASEASNMQTPQATTTETPSYAGSSAGNTEIMDKLERLDKRISELFTGVSRLTDRVDLNERKIERLERKTGVGDNY